MHSEEDNYYEEPDWTREKPQRFWDPSRKLIKTIRRYQKLKAKPNLLNTLLSKLYVFEHRFWSIVTGADIPINTEIGGGFLMPHPNGVVIHADAKIGNNCLFFQQVTIAGSCVIGHHVDIGAGAKIIGPLTLASLVNVGANAVVTKDVSFKQTMVGIPAKALKK